MEKPHRPSFRTNFENYRRQFGPRDVVRVFVQARYRYILWLRRPALESFHVSYGGMKGKSFTQTSHKVAICKERVVPLCVQAIIRRLFGYHYAVYVGFLKSGLGDSHEVGLLL